MINTIKLPIERKHHILSSLIFPWVFLQMRLDFHGNHQKFRSMHKYTTPLLLFAQHRDSSSCHLRNLN